ncbi:hypothetical protein [Paramagnetospirillum kuznetsovii]|nr:hypothetical protein [Paramagnetospirillum kuznetsovii]
MAQIQSETMSALHRIIDLLRQFKTLERSEAAITRKRDQVACHLDQIPGTRTRSANIGPNCGSNME